MTEENLLQHTAGPLESERVVEILRHDGVRIERIVSRGHASPEGFWYDQNDNEWVAVLAGSAALRFEGDEIPVGLHAGDQLATAALATRIETSRGVSSTRRQSGAWRRTTSPRP